VCAVEVKYSSINRVVLQSQNMTSMQFLMSKGIPTSGNVNSSAPFGFGASSDVKSDYGSKPNVNALMKPTLHNSVPESMVNSTASVPLFVRPFSSGFEKGYSEGDLLFVERNEKSRDTIHNCVANLPVINYFLRTAVNKEGDPGVLDNSKKVGQPKYQNVQDVLDNWNYFGILNTDMDSGSKWQRLLNINVRGRSRVARLWKPPKEQGHLHKGTCVYLGLFSVDNTVAVRTKNPNGQLEMAKGNYLQFKATLECCTKDNGLGNVFTEAKYLIPIGIVSQLTLKSPSNQAILDAHKITESCKSLERIELLMRI